ncbi:Uncharacterised protein [Candidatus Burarchaeum australiense]|nr:Uncharacterised protein [Candidatus Burarchaeum australiense]
MRTEHDEVKLMNSGNGIPLTKTAMLRKGPLEVITPGRRGDRLFATIGSRLDGMIEQPNFVRNRRAARDADREPEKKRMQKDEPQEKVAGTLAAPYCIAPDASTGMSQFRNDILALADFIESTPDRRARKVALKRLETMCSDVAPGLAAEVRRHIESQPKASNTRGKSIQEALKDGMEKIRAVIETGLEVLTPKQPAPVKTEG